jgi:hypothetical protein
MQRIHCLSKTNEILISKYYIRRELFLLDFYLKTVDFEVHFVSGKKHFECSDICNCLDLNTNMVIGLMTLQCLGHKSKQND